MAAAVAPLERPDACIHQQMGRDVMARPMALAADRVTRHVMVGFSDSYVFLETNPFGQWLWIEDLTGLPITKAIAGYLAAPPE
jgi:hypothetical protein